MIKFKYCAPSITYTYSNTDADNLVFVALKNNATRSDDGPVLYARGQKMEFVNSVWKTWVNTAISSIPTKLSDLSDLTLTGYDNKKFGIQLTQAGNNAGDNVDIGWQWSGAHGAGSYFRSSATGSVDAGAFGFYAKKDGAETQFIGYPDGTLKWNNKDIVNEVGTSGSGNFLTGVSQSGGKLTFSKGNPYVSVSASDLDFGVIRCGPEDRKRVLIPYVCNDIAFLTQRGGSATVTKNGVIQDVDLSKAFDGTTDHVNISNVVPSDVFVIELTLHKVFPYGSNVYLNSKGTIFRAKSIKLEVINTNYANDTWETIADITNNESDYWINNYVSHNAVGSGNTDSRDGFNKIRFTLTDANNATLRIGEIGIYGCQSLGIPETLVSRGGSEMFGNLTPYTSGTLHLGTSSKPWLETYTNYLHTDYINGEAVAMYRSEKRNTATSGTVTLNPNEFTSITPSANVTIALGSFSDSANYICGYHCIVNNSGNKTVTLPSGVTWMGGTAPTIESGTIIELHILRDNSMLYGTYVEY